MTEDVLWSSFGVTGDSLQERAAWLSEKRNLHSTCHRFFEQAGTLVFFSVSSYPLASVAFFHAIPGLERALRLHYEDEEKEKSLNELLKRAVDGQILND